MTGYAEGGVAVQDGDADLEFGDLAVELPVHEPLSQKLQAMHLGFDAAPTVIATPSSPQSAAEVFGWPKGLVSGDGSGGDSFPRLRILAGRDDGMGATIGDRIMAFSGIAGAVGGDAADLLVRRDLVEQIGQHRRITDVAPGDLDGPYFQRLFVDPKVDLTP